MVEGGVVCGGDMQLLFSPSLLSPLQKCTRDIMTEEDQEGKHVGVHGPCVVEGARCEMGLVFEGVHHSHVHIPDMVQNVVGLEA